jgi:hypothetical protein
MKQRRILALLILSALSLWGADLTGTWTAAVVLDAGSGSATFTFKQTGEQLSGTYSGTFGEAKVSGTVKGDRAEWSFEIDQVGKVFYTGEIASATEIKGSVEYGLLGKGTFTAQKK